MRSADDRRDDPVPAGALLAIDAALDGEPADPEFADLAELARLLADERPACPAAFAASLDARVARRFTTPASPAAAPRRRWWQGTAGWSLGATGVVAGLAALVVLIGGGGGSSSASYSSSAAGGAASAVSSSTSGSASSGSVASAAPGVAGGSHGRAARNLSGAQKVAPYAANGSLPRSRSAAGSSAAGSSSGPAPTPVPSGQRQIVQGAQLALSTSPGRVDAVAQEVFNAVGDEQGIVNRSDVTANGTNSGGADFQLSVPSANLASTLDALSRLPGANVVSRTDTSSDITGQVGGAGMRLAEARALRSSLLRQLAAATTTSAADALKAKIAAVDGTIAADETQLNGLHRQVAYSQISVTIAAVTPPAHHQGATPFSLGRAWHDAGRVLVVVAGVGLIALAVLLPVGLLAALVAWVAYALRRHRREQALDAA